MTAANKLDDDENLKKKYAATSAQLAHHHKTTKKARLDITVDNDNDSSFEALSSLLESEDDEVEMLISNIELASSLPAILTTGCHAQKTKHTCHVTMEEVKDVNSPRNLTPSSTSIIESDQAKTEPQAEKKSNMIIRYNPIYYFYESVSHDTDGKIGGEKDQHYKCFYGNWKVLTITPSMKCNVTSLVKALKDASSTVHTFYLLLKDWIENNKHITAG
ncbi:hypothetical protein H0H87_000773 [Tephrocybe sp. NHM501043]|nr:hypothetical protein H0H87_000773 [Tephrocybe sp. NHM501043]